MAEALSGRRIPTWPVVASIVRELGGAEATFRGLWSVATNESPAPTENERQDSGFIERYRELVAEYYGTLRGVDLVGQYRGSLDNLFVPPKLAAVAAERLESGDSTVVDATELLDEAHRVVVLGDPGSGKSTLCQWLMRHHATRHDLPVPFLVPVREFAAEFPPSRSVIGFIEARIEAVLQTRPPSGVVERQLSAGFALVIFDGLDEVLRPHHRAEFVSIIQLFAEENPGAQILVTSRAVGYARSPLNPQDYRTYRILELDDSAVRRFAQTWFTLDNPGVDANRLADALIQETKDIASLRKNPLLLSLLCVLFGKTRSVPRARADLYQQIAALMFEEWDTQRGIAWPMQAPSLVTSVLGNLAIKMLISGKDSIAERELARITRQFIEDRMEVSDPEQGAREMVDFFRNRSWGLVSRGAGAGGEETFSFVHRTLLEYFAAQHVVRTRGRPEDIAQQLVDHVSAPRWAEVGKLTIQLADRNIESGAERIVERLLDSLGGLSSVQKSQLLHLLTDISEVEDLPDKTRRRIAAAAEAPIRGTSDIDATQPQSEVSSDDGAFPWPISSAVPEGVNRGLVAIQELLQRFPADPEPARMAVTWIWATFDASVRGFLPRDVFGLAEDIGLPNLPLVMNPASVARKLNLITEQEAALLKQAYQMRSSIVHGSSASRQAEFSRDAAVRVVRAVHDAVSAIFERAADMGIEQVNPG